MSSWDVDMHTRGMKGKESFWTFMDRIDSVYGYTFRLQDLEPYGMGHDVWKVSIPTDDGNDEDVVAEEWYVVF